MSKVFLTSKDLKVNKAGYLTNVAGKTTTYVTNSEFVKAQKRAEYLVTLAGKMEGKVFEAVAPTNINTLMAEVDEELNGVKTEEFIKVEAVSKGTLTSQLAEEALAFIKGTDDNADAAKVNAKLQEFKVVSKFEKVGLFFTGDTVELSKIYTMKQIIAAAKVVYAVLD